MKLLVVYDDRIQCLDGSGSLLGMMLLTYDLLRSLRSQAIDLSYATPSGSTMDTVCFATSATRGCISCTLEAVGQSYVGSGVHRHQWCSSPLSPCYDTTDAISRRWVCPHQSWLFSILRRRARLEVCPVPLVVSSDKTFPVTLKFEKLRRYRRALLAWYDMTKHAPSPLSRHG